MTTARRPRSRKSAPEIDADADQLVAEGALDIPVEHLEEDSYPLAERTEMPTSAAGTYALAAMSDEGFSQQLALMKRGRDRIAQIQREVMVQDVDYGLIPGTPKPTLFKPGAEKLALMYGLAAEMKHEFIPGDGDAAPSIQYHATAFLHLSSFDGPIVAVGHGTANSWEKRYRRDAQKTCPNCGKTTSIIKSKPQFGGGWYCFPKKEGCGMSFKIDDPAMTEQATDAKGDSVGSWDLGNTLLKMAEKRAFVDVVLRATASSSLFTQDVAEEPDVDNSDAPSAARRVDTSSGGDYMDTSGETAKEAEYRRQETQAEPEPEVRSAELGEVQRGGHRGEVTKTQIDEARRIATSMKLTPWEMADVVADAVGGIDSTELPDDKPGAGAVLLAFMQSMKPDDMGKVITALRTKAAEQA